MILEVILFIYSLSCSSLSSVSRVISISVTWYFSFSLLYPISVYLLSDSYKSISYKPNSSRTSSRCSIIHFTSSGSERTITSSNTRNHPLRWSDTEHLPDGKQKRHDPKPHRGGIWLSVPFCESFVMLLMFLIPLKLPFCHLAAVFSSSVIISLPAVLNAV